MKNKANKRLLSQLLCICNDSHLANNTEFVSQADSIAQHEEADISIITYMLHAASTGAQTVGILSDETDIFVLLLEELHCTCTDIAQQN